MRGSRNSKPARISRAAYSATPLLWTALFASLISVGAIWFFYRNGSLMNYGDAESHLNIARRVLDSRTPGYEQLGTTWLPLPHILMLPFVRSMTLWRTGLAGSIPAAACFVSAALFVFATARRVFENLSSAALATGLFVLNPNLLFLQSTAMTEAVFFVCLFGLLYFLVVFQQTGSTGAAIGAGIMATAGTLTRYEGWFLLPFAAFCFFPKWRAVIIFSAIAALGPLLWLGYNWWIFDNPLEFFNGASSAKAIQAGRTYPGLNDWPLAIKYFHAAAELALGTPLFWISLAGVLACLIRFRLGLLLALPPLFYIWSMHSSGSTPIHVPHLPPNGWYNTRYGLALLPLGAFGAAAIAGLMPRTIRFAAASLLLVLGAGQWLLFPRPTSWITWKEAQVNSDARLAWTNEAVTYLAAHYTSGESIFTAPGDMTGIYRRLGIPIRRTLTIDNGPLYLATLGRPDLFLWETWVVCFAGDTVQTAVDRAALHGPKYELVKMIAAKGAPVVQIYKSPPRILHR